MEDKKIVDLYWKRDETAIQETEKKYKNYLMKIAYNVLFDMEDCKEVLNDTYLRAWFSMPEHKPNILSVYLARITRQLAIDIFRKKHSKKRDMGYVFPLSELDECITNGQTPEQEIELQALADTINAYLQTLSCQYRNVFICRYFFMDSIQDIASYLGAGEPKVRSILFRCRKGLKAYLEQEGFFL